MSDPIKEAANRLAIAPSNIIHVSQEDLDWLLSPNSADPEAAQVADEVFGEFGQTWELIEGTDGEAVAITTEPSLFHEGPKHPGFIVISNGALRTDMKLTE